MGLIKPKKNTGGEHSLRDCAVTLHGNSIAKSEGLFTAGDEIKQRWHYEDINGVQLTPSFGMAVEKNDFGNATAADVATGKTFTSVNGLCITGTGELKQTVSVTITSYVNDTTKVCYEGTTFTLAANGTQTINCTPDSLVAIQTPTASSNASITNGTRVLGASSYGSKQVVVFKVNSGSAISIA